MKEKKKIKHFTMYVLQNSINLVFTDVKEMILIQRKEVHIICQKTTNQIFKYSQRD